MCTDTTVNGRRWSSESWVKLSMRWKMVCAPSHIWYSTASHPYRAEDEQARSRQPSSLLSKFQIYCNRAADLNNWLGKDEVPEDLVTEYDDYGHMKYAATHPRASLGFAVAERNEV
eukprot:132981-Rhodomonas_salina.2